MAVNKKLRFEVFHRDGFRCRYCGRKPPEVVLECDHVVAVANGGGDDIENLVTACFDCNRGKSATPLTEPPDTVEERMQRRQEAMDQAREYSEVLAAERRLHEELAGAIGTEWFNKISDEKDKYTFGTERMNSVIRFVKQMPLHEIYEAMDIAFQKRPPTKSTGYDQQTFRYFCGICWNKLRDAGAIE